MVWKFAALALMAGTLSLSSCQFYGSNDVIADAALRRPPVEDGTYCLYLVEEGDAAGLARDRCVRVAWSGARSLYDSVTLGDWDTEFNTMQAAALSGGFHALQFTYDDADEGRFAVAPAFLGDNAVVIIPRPPSCENGEPGGDYCAAEGDELNFETAEDGRAFLSAAVTAWRDELAGDVANLIIGVDDGASAWLLLRVDDLHTLKEEEEAIGAALDAFEAQVL